jgi:ABC-type lipoprotein export system ATPase subunit
MATNADLLKTIKKAPRAHFYLCDVHVHSPASLDVSIGERFSALSEKEKEYLQEVTTTNHGGPVDYEAKVLSTFPVERYYDLLVKRRNTVSEEESIPEGEDWAFIAITDHNVCEYATSLSNYAWEHRSDSRLVILPGIELDVSFPITSDERVIAHLILIFQPGTQSSDIRVAIEPLTSNSWSFGQTAKVSDLPKFVSQVRNHSSYPAITIAAHISSGKGVRGEALKRGHKNLNFTALDAAIARTLGEIEHNSEADRATLKSRLKELEDEQMREAEKISLEILKLVGSCGFDALQVSCKQDEIHYRRLHRFREEHGRAVPLVASDAHRVDDVFACEGNIPYLKLPVQSLAICPDQVLRQLRRAIRYGETRFSYCTPGQVRKWIAGLEIIPDASGASHFWPYVHDGADRDSFILSLSRNLNCLVGGRGSGKSAAIEALAFITVPAGFEGKYRKKDEDLPDWYKRARATLQGCQVRLVWQNSGKVDLPKGALFCSRYFNPSGESERVSYTDLEDKEILGSAVSVEAPQLLRARDIENAVEPDRLRKLFDELVGDKITKISENIDDLVGKLSDQREIMVSIARQIAELTKEDAPLREYVRRKAAYETVNQPEVQPFYKHLDEAAAAESLAKDLKTRWDQAQDDADFEKHKSTLLDILDAVKKNIKDKDEAIKPYCEEIAKLFEKDKEGKSVRDRLECEFEHLREALDSIKGMIVFAVTQTKSAHKDAREELTKKGLPPGAKDREAKKLEFEEAERGLAKYRELIKQWKSLLDIRNKLFESLVAECQKRTQLRTETAKRICTQLDRDLDSSILVIHIEVHPTEDRTSLRSWLSKNVSPCIPKSKDARISALMDKQIMPKEIRDSLLGGVTNCSEVFVVEKEKAGEGRVEEELAHTIVQRCAGRVKLQPEHKIVTEPVSGEFIKKLPQEIQKGLWTFPEDGLNSDAVLALDEVVFDDRPEILLNDRPRDPGSKPRPIEELSNGQRCSAILPILLLNGQSPLIIDQPEDNLDNRLIRQVIVNILASIKLRRQVIIATHNPNLPVLGDVEQAIVLRAIEEKQARLESIGDLDSPETVTHLMDIMEGGREAFQYRQSIYQAHWGGPVDPRI